MDPARRILLVEDEPDISASLKDLLEMQIPGAEVSIAPNGAEGLRHLASAHPQLVISDYKMPGMSGLEFLAAARAAAPDTPRMLMTAYPDLGIATRAINDAHIASFLAKPIEPEELLQKIVAVFQKLEAKAETERVLARTLREHAATLNAAKKG